MERKEILHLEKVAFSYTSEEFLKNVTFSIYEDDFVGIIGPNGGGKTTLLKLMLGLLEPQEGSIRIFGREPVKARTEMGYLSQFKNIDFDFPITVYEIVLLGRAGRKIFKHFSRKDKAAAQKALQQMALWELRDKKLNELSGGQKQRVFVSRALVNDPRILILDEPMSNLDMHIQEEFYNILKELNKKITIVIVDHDLEMLTRYTKEVVCVNKCKTHAIEYHETNSLKIKEICLV
jgi:zinc transport system ATP-binding protein